MSIDKRLEHELAINHPDEQERINDIESDRAAQFAVLQKSHHTVASRSSKEPSLNYLIRDQAFFKIVHSTQRLKSKLTMLSQFDQPVSLPNISARDAKITSVLERYDPERTAFLVDFESFITDQARHDRRIISISNWTRDIRDEIISNTVPSLLFFVFKWIPFVFQIYQYFSPENPVNTYIHRGEILIQELEDLEKDLIKEDMVYYARWQEKYQRYYAMSMNLQKVTQFLHEHEVYTQLSQAQEDLEDLIFSTKKMAPLKEAYQQFSHQPSYVTLLQLCTQLGQLRQTLQSRDQDSSRVDRAFQTLGELYPEVKPHLQTYVKETLENINDRKKYTHLEDVLKENINKNRSLLDRIKKAEGRMGESSKKAASLGKPTQENRDLINAANDEIRKMANFIEKASQQMTHRRKLIEPLKDFINHRTAENLQKLYQYAATADTADHQEYAEILRSIYPATLDALEAENQEIMLSLNDETFKHLQNLFQRNITQVEHSDRKVTEVLSSLLSSPDWTWGQFSDLEEAIENNPNYMRNPHLAALMDQITHTVMGAKLFRERIPKNPVAKKASSMQPELVIPQNTTTPTFFQPAARNESEFTQTVKEKMRGHKNAYSINSSWEKLTSAQKQEAIDTMVHHILQYINIVSDEDRIQTIGYEHLSLLTTIADFARKMTAAEDHRLMNEAEFQRVADLLKRLETQHPIREYTEFIIDVFRTKDEYAAIDTSYVQKQLRKDLNEEIQVQEKYLESRQKSLKHNTRSPDASMNSVNWSAARGFQKLIKDYADKLQQNPSDANREEMSWLRQILTDADTIYNIVRGENKVNTQHLEGILLNFKQYCTTLENHPLNDVLSQFIRSLQATTEYTKFPLSTEDSILRKTNGI